MNRNLITGVVVTSVLTIVFMIVFYYTKINTKSINAINVLPRNTVFAIEIKNVKLQYKLLNQQSFWQQLTQNNFLAEANSNLNYLDSILNYETTLKEWKEDNNIVISFHAYKNKSIDALLMVETRKSFDIHDISNWIATFNKNRFIVNKRKFLNNNIYDFTDFKNNRKFSFAVKNKIFTFSMNGQLIEEALLNIENKKTYDISRLDKLSFVKSMGTYNLYLNYNNLPVFFNTFINSNKIQALNKLPLMANWTALGVNSGNDYLKLKGVSITDENIFQYFDCFNKMEAKEQSIKKLLPENTSYYLGINFNDDETFNKNLKEFYTVNNIDSRNFKRDSIDKVKNKPNLYKNIISTLGNEIAQVGVKNMQLSFDSCQLLIIKIKDKDKLLNELKGIDLKDTLSTDTILNNASNFYKINLKNYFDYTWGPLFLGIEADYAIVYNDYLIVANNKIVLNEFYLNQLSSSLLVKNLDYVNHLSKINTNSNIDFLINSSNLSQQNESFLQNDMIELYKKNTGYFNKAKFISFQVNATNDKNYITNLLISFNINANKKTELLWELPLDTSINSKPQIVYNSASNQNCIMVQDASNQVYLINMDSKILFKFPVFGKIISTIHEVDAFKNGKTQYLFNTNTQIFLLDENGKNLQGYPLWIPTGTNFPLQVNDYLNDKTYQIFVIGKYYKIWCYNIQARLLSGWNPKNYYPNPIQNIQTFTFRNELISYLINEKGKLNFFTLNGKKFSSFGLDTNAIYKYIKHEMLDSNNIKFYFIDSSKVFKIKEYHTTLPSKNYNLNTIRSIPISEVYLDKNMYFIVKKYTSTSIYNSMGKEVYNKNFNDTLNYQLDIIVKNNVPYFSYLNPLEGKLYLENKKYKTEESFPLNANYYYTFGYLMNDNNLFLITSNIDKKLFVYQIK